MRPAPVLLLSSLLLLGSALPATAADQPAQAAAVAPSPEQATTYKLTFVVTELKDGKVEGRRSYTALFNPSYQNDGSIRTGDRIPVSTGSTSGITSTVTTNYIYLDVGTDMDFRIPSEFRHATRFEQLPLIVSVELSSYVDASQGEAHDPVIRQDKWSSAFNIDIGKPRLLFSSDEPSGDIVTKVELTVTRVQP